MRFIYPKRRHTRPRVRAKKWHLVDLAAAFVAATERIEHFAIEHHGKALAARIRTGAIAAGRDARLADLADVPVLAVGQIPEGDAVLHVPRLVAHAVRMKEPLAGNE